MSLYLILNLMIVSVPFVCLFHSSLRALRHFKALAICIGLVSSFFIVWDIIAEVRGHWAFNPSYVGSRELAGLPIEEWLFFITVPFSCLFLYDVFDHLCVKRNHIKIMRHFQKPITRVGTVAALSLIAFGVYSWPLEYTTIVFTFTGIWLLFTLIWDYSLLTSRAVLYYHGLGFVLFCIFNTVLTAVPVVTYSPDSITGTRIGTIPIEDFFYNMLLLGLYVQLYRWQIAKEISTQ